jgi:hypothetical protein
MKKYLITGLLIWIPLVITLWVLKLIVDALDQTLLLLPREFQTENWLGLHVPGMGVVMTLVIVFVTGLLATNLVGARLVPSGTRSAPHPGGQLDLLQRQADLRHAVLLQRPGIQEGAAGAVAAPGHVDHRLPHRHARRRCRQSPQG